MLLAGRAKKALFTTGFLGTNGLKTLDLGVTGMLRWPLELGKTKNQKQKSHNSPVLLMDTSAKQQVIERLKQANNVLVTVNSDPSVDQLAAAIGLTLMINKLDKHATAVFSGKPPSTIEFLKPEETLERDTDSLRDFIISLDKNKADKLRYKVEDDVVRIFITPYRTSITQDDLVFSQGDINVDVVVALGVTSNLPIDNAIIAHGRILHDAAVVCVNAGEATSDIGQINWNDPGASSLCEMIVSISEAFGSGLIDGQMATAFLTGIVAQTERFSNNKTTPKIMTMSAQLMAAGANQQLIASELGKPVGPQIEGEPAEKGVEIDHADLPPVAPIFIDETGNLERKDGVPSDRPPDEDQPSVSEPPPLAETPPSESDLMQAVPMEKPDESQPAEPPKDIKEPERAIQPVEPGSEQKPPQTAKKKDSAGPADDQPLDFADKEPLAGAMSAVDAGITDEDDVPSLEVKTDIPMLGTHDKQKNERDSQDATAPFSLPAAQPPSGERTAAGIKTIEPLSKPHVPYQPPESSSATLSQIEKEISDSVAKAEEPPAASSDLENARNAVTSAIAPTPPGPATEGPAATLNASPPAGNLSQPPPPPPPQPDLYSEAVVTPGSMPGQPPSGLSLPPIPPSAAAEGQGSAGQQPASGQLAVPLANDQPLVPGLPATPPPVPPPLMPTAGLTNPGATTEAVTPNPPQNAA